MKNSQEDIILQTAPEVLAALRAIAIRQGLTLDDVLDQALREYIDRWQAQQRHTKVAQAFAGSVDEFDSLYRALATAPSSPSTFAPSKHMPDLK